MEVRLIRKNITQFLLSSNRINSTIWMHHLNADKVLREKPDGNWTRMLQAIINVSWNQQPTKQLLYSNLPPISKTIQIRRTRHGGHCWRSKNEHLSDVLPWTLLHGHARPTGTYLQQLCTDTGCSLEDLLEATDIGVEWRDRESGNPC